MFAGAAIFLFFTCLWGGATAVEIFHKRRAKQIRQGLTLTVFFLGMTLLVSYMLYLGRHNPRAWGTGSNGCYFNVC
jgi:hypothetical protein